MLSSDLHPRPFNHSIHLWMCIVCLFADITSAFNTIVPSILLVSMNVPYYRQSLLKAFLVDRQQYVRIRNSKPSFLNCDIGCPQGLVLSPALFSILNMQMISVFLVSLILTTFILHSHILTLSRFLSTNIHL